MAKGYIELRQGDDWWQGTAEIVALRAARDKSTFDTSPPDWAIEAVQAASDRFHARERERKARGYK